MKDEEVDVVGADEDNGHVEIVFDAANLDDVRVVLDEAVVADCVCIVVIVILLDDDVVVVDEVDVLVDVVVVANLIAVTDNKVVHDDLDVVVVAVDVDELLMIQGDVYEVSVDHLDGVVVRLPPVDVVLDVEVVVNDVEDDVSPLIENDAMRPASSIFRCTRMCDD